MQSKHYSSKSLDHLGLISGLCTELGIAQFIDDLFPEQSSNRRISYGKLLEAMLLNGLGFVSRTLHMYPAYFSDKPVDRLLGPGIEAEHINDDALGRCLDKLYEQGVSDVYQSLAEKVVNHLGLACQSLHLDSTSFHVDGAYESEDDLQTIRITKGYSRDHRPELNQVILNLITENQAGLPVYMQACSGNTNDSEGFKKIVKSHIASLKSAQQCRYFVGDAALYSVETIQSLSEQNQLFITRVPQKLTTAKAVISNKHNCDFTTLANGYSGCWFESDYAEVKQRWLLIRSEQASKRESHTLKKRFLKLGEKSISEFKKLRRQIFSCDVDARKALSQWQTKHPHVDVVNISIEARVKHKGRGRPSKNSPCENEYKIEGSLCSPINQYSKEKESKGFFILATNDCENELSMQAMLDHYKSQQTVEKGFRFLKSPDFLTSSLYLKKPERIEALLMVMTCCLMIYAAMEHLIRRELEAKNLFFPDMKKKPGQKPTARWVFFCFQGIHLLIINKEERHIVNMQELHRTILRCLGPSYQDIYS